MSKPKRNGKDAKHGSKREITRTAYQMPTKTESDANQTMSFAETYEINRENTLVSQAGLITAVFSFSTTALFTVWQVGLDELDAIPDVAIHIAMGVITFLLLLSMLFAVLALYQIIDTSKIKPDNIDVIKNNNNVMVRRIKASIRLFLWALAFVFLVAIVFGLCFYCC